MATARWPHTLAQQHAGPAARGTPALPRPTPARSRPREQAHLSAEQPPPGEGPRLPAAHAHARRPLDPGGAPSQGPLRAVGLTRLALSAPAVTVLPTEHRLRRPADFTEVVRRGRRASAALLTVHLLQADADEQAAGSGCRAGLVVSKAVGNSVVRHRTARRLRHLLRAQILGPASPIPAGSRLVVRASPRAGVATSAELASDLDAALQRVLAGRPSAARSGAVG